MSSLLLSVVSCVDAPSGPEGSGSPGAYVIAPAFSLVGPGGERPQTVAQQDALNAAFDQVDRFRMVVKRVSDNVVVLDTVLVVKPGAAEYDLSVSLAAKDNEEFLVTLTAMQGTTLLFTAENIPAKASPPGVPGSPPPAAVQIPLVYTGPGSTAASVVVGPAQVVLAAGGSATVGASVKDAGGAVIAGVPVAWSTSASGVATVTGSGVVTAVADGLATVTVTTPTGLAASATVYVVAGELAYVEGGVLKVRGAVGGTATERASGGAAQPAWSADGARLYYVAGGSVWRAGGPPLTSGSWPSVSPDGTKLALERGGQVWFVNDDGSEATQGPSGSSPVWADASHLLVGGGSVQRVKADGTGRTTVVAGDASLPALAGDGRIASVAGGALRVTGVGSALVSGATGRPTWSPNGRWLVVATASGLVLAPADGSAAGVALPGLAGASDPAFKPTGTLAAAPGVSVSGFNPDPPIPGTQVQVLGSGFDWIIRTNNRVTWPTRDGTVESSVGVVTEGSITTTMPRNVIAGQVRVQTRSSTGLLAFVPTVGSLEVTARTPWDAARAGVGLALTGPSGPLGGTTDAGGSLVLSGLIPGTYTATITPPVGWELVGERVRTLAIGAEAFALTLELSPIVASVALSPEAPALAVGASLPVTLVVMGADGTAIPQVQGLAWRSGSSELVVTAGSGLGATLTAMYAGEGAGSSVLEASFGGKTYTFPVTVTTGISGTILKDTGVTPPPAAADVVVQVKKGGVAVAEARTGADGRYSVTGLFRGTYDVVPQPLADLLPVPAGQTVILDAVNPAGRADFKMQSFAGLDVTALTPWSTPVAGVVLRLLDANGIEVARDTTDVMGMGGFPRLAPGTYTLAIAVPAGFLLTGDASRTLVFTGGAQTLALQVEPLVQSVKTVPEVLALEVGTPISVQLVPLDARGGIIPQVKSVTWIGGRGLEAGGVLLAGTLAATWASLEEAALECRIEINGRVFSFPVTATTAIAGTITKDPPLTPAGPSAVDGIAVATLPAQDVTVVLKREGSVVGEARTNEGGVYRFSGLFQGTYEVVPGTQGDLSPVPGSGLVVLDETHPKGTADFHMSRGAVDSIYVTVSPDSLHALGATAQVTVQAFDTAGAPMGGRTTTYVSTNPAVATVDATGKVTAVSNGSAWIRTTVESEVDSVLVVVDQEAVTLVLKNEEGETLPDSIRTLWGETHQLKWEARDARGNLIPPEYKQPTFMSSDATKVWVDTAEVAHISTSKVGPADVTATMDEVSDVVRVGVHGVRSGDLTLPGDLGVIADSLYGRVMGSVWVVETPLTNLDALRTVWDVWGSVDIGYNSSLVSLAGLGNLETVDGYVYIIQNNALTTPAGLPAAALKHVGGALKVWDNDNPGFTNADMFGNLVEVGGDVDISGNDYLADLGGVTSLKQAYGLSLESNQSLDLDGAFPALEYLGWNGLWIDESATVARLPMLRGVEGGIGVGGEVEEVNPIQELDLPGLVCVEGEVWIYDNQALETVKMPNLVSVGTSCATPFDDIPGVAPMTHSAASAAKDADPTDRGMARFRGTAEARLRALDQEAKARLEKRRSARETRRIEAAREAAALREPAGASAGPARSWTRAARPGRADGPQAGGCECGSGLTIEYNYLLNTLDLGSLEEVNGPLSLYALYVLEVVDLPELRTVGEWLSVSELYGLTAFRAPRLQYAGDFYLQASDYLAALDLSGLTEVGDFDLWGRDHGDEGSEAPSRSAPQRPSEPPTWNLDLLSLEQVYGYFYLGGIWNLRTLVSDNLRSVGGDMTIEDMASLENFSFSHLEWVHCYGSESCVLIEDNPSLTSFDMPNMFTYEFHLSYNDELETLPDLGGLAGGGENSASVVIEGNANLSALDGLAGVQRLYGLALYNTAVTDLSALNTEGAPLSHLTYLSLYWNTGLQNLNGFAGLVSNMESVHISSNPALTDVTGLNGLGTGESPNPVVRGSFSFTSNITLCTEYVNALFAAIEAANPPDAGGVALPNKVNTGQLGCF